MVRAAMLLAGLAAAPAVAADPSLISGRPADIMRAALGLCLDRRDEPGAALDALVAAGWASEGADDAGAWRLALNGVVAYLDERTASCRLESAAVSVAQARILGAEVVARRFPGQFRRDPATGPAAPCGGLTIWPPSGAVLVLRYRSPEAPPACPPPAAATIIVGVAL